MYCTSYDCLMIEFLSSLNGDWYGNYGRHEVAIYFRMFNVDHQMSLRMFNELLRFSVVDGAFRDVPSLWQPDPVWLSITCSKRKTYMDRFRRPRAFNPHQAKATDICNINLCYDITFNI